MSLRLSTQVIPVLAHLAVPHCLVEDKLGSCLQVQSHFVSLCWLGGRGDGVGPCETQGEFQVPAIPAVVGKWGVNKLIPFSLFFLSLYVAPSKK